MRGKERRNIRSRDHDRDASQTDDRNKRVGNGEEFGMKNRVEYVIHDIRKLGFRIYLYAYINDK